MSTAVMTTTTTITPATFRPSVSVYDPTYRTTAEQIRAQHDQILGLTREVNRLRILNRELNSMIDSAVEFIDGLQVDSAHRERNEQQEEVGFAERRIDDLALTIAEAMAEVERLEDKLPDLPVSADATSIETL